MSKQRLKVWPVRAYEHACGFPGIPPWSLTVSLSGNSKQRRRGARLLMRRGYHVDADPNGRPGQLLAIPK